MTKNSYPKLHNATWPGIVGKGPDSEPPISLEKMLEMTAAAEVDGVKFDGVDVGLFDNFSVLLSRLSGNNFDTAGRKLTKTQSRGELFQL